MTDQEAKQAKDALAKVNADEIKDAEATEKGARGATGTEPPHPTDIDLPPPLPH